MEQHTQVTDGVQCFRVIVAEHAPPTLERFAEVRFSLLIFPLTPEQNTHVIDGGKRDRGFVSERAPSAIQSLAQVLLRSLEITLSIEH